MLAFSLSFSMKLLVVWIQMPCDIKRLILSQCWELVKCDCKERLIVPSLCTMTILTSTDTTAKASGTVIKWTLSHVP